MWLRAFLCVFFMVAFTASAQQFKSDGDKFFYAYAYRDAIKAYQKQMAKGEKLTNFQFLNLADSYYKSGDYQNATKIYLDINKKDSIMSDNRFNNMMQCLAKTSEPERVKAFLKSKKGTLDNELFENAKFNYEILEDNIGAGSEFSVFNLNINSPQSDISPSFYKDRLLFSTSRKNKSKKIYGPSGESYLDIYIARIGKGGILLGQNAFSGLPKANFHKSTPFYSDELNGIFYIHSNTDEDGNLVFNNKDKNALAIGFLDRKGNFQYVLRDLSNSFYYPFYHDQAGKLYFAANLEGGYGGTDIYYVSMNRGQVMSQPVNLGPRINTPGNEIAPYIFENSMYFSSDVFYGLGGMDVYKANIQEDQSFGIPVNLGNAINSKKDDFGFIIRPNTQGQGLMGYFSSNRLGGAGSDDIYGFRVEGTLGLRTLVFKGKVANKRSNFAIADATVKILDANRNVLKEVVTQADGTYRIEIPWRAQVSLIASKPKHSIFYKTFDEATSDSSNFGNLDIQISMVSDIIEEKENKNVLKLENFKFEPKKSTLTTALTANLDTAISLIQQFPRIRIRIETHTSSKGRNATNKLISQERADAMLTYLRQRGVSNANVTSAIGYGEELLLNNCSNGVYCLDFLHEQNERTLFVVLNYDEINQ